MSSRSLLFVALLLASIGVGLYVRGVTSRSAKPGDAAPVAAPAAERRSSWSAGSDGDSAPQAERDAMRSAAHIEAEAARLAAAETRTRNQIRSTLEQVLAGKLADREITPSNYDRLADAVLEIRAANRVLKGIPYSEATADLRAQRIASMRAAIAVFHDVTGVAPSSLGDILGDAGEEGVEAPR